MKARYCFLLLLAPVVFFSFFSLAAEDAGNSKPSPEMVIRAQLEAFQSGDVATAYEYAAPAVKRHFPNVDTFGEMVRTGYKPLYSPRSMLFTNFMTQHEPPLQHVIVIGPAGRAWDAYYLMTTNVDGDWKVAGVRLLPRNETAI